MNSKEILEHLDRLADMTPTEKKNALADLLPDTTFTRVVKFALDPFFTYGINKIEYPVPGTTVFGLSTWELLEWLANRVLTGNAARTATDGELAKLEPASQELLKRIITKDLRCGVTADTVNGVYPGTVPAFKCQLSQPYEERHIKKWPVAVEPKYDGYRALLMLDENGGKFVSRKGKVFTAVQWLADEIHQYVFQERRMLLNTVSPMVVDGEIVHKDDDFYKIGGARGKSEFRDARFMVFDILPADRFKRGEDTDSYVYRRAAAKVWVGDLNNRSVDLTPAWVAHSDEEVMGFYAGVRDQGGEGVMVKNLDAGYECKRSRNWLKIKDQLTVDCPIVHMEEGTGKYKGMMGAVGVDFNGVRVRVGSGFSDEQRRALWNYSDLGEPIPYGRMIEIEYHEMTPDGSLRHPRFVRFRDDKSPEDGPGI